MEREKAGIQATDAEILDNPYLLYELDRFSPNAIALSIIDRGVFPDEIVREKHPAARTLRASTTTRWRTAGCGP